MGSLVGASTSWTPPSPLQTSPRVRLFGWDDHPSIANSPHAFSRPLTPFPVLGDIMQGLHLDAVSKADLLVSNFNTGLLSRLRFVAALWCVATLFLLVWRWRSNQLLVSLGFICVAFSALYFLLVITLLYVHRMYYKQLRSYAEKLFNRRAAGRLMYVAWILFELLVPATLMVFFLNYVYVIPHDGHKHSVWTGYHFHIFNLLCLLIELWLNRLPVVASHVVFFALFWGAYVGLVFGYHSASDTWVYYFLDTSGSHMTAHYVVFLLVPFVAFFLVWGIARLRDVLASNQVQAPEEEDTKPENLDLSMQCIDSEGETDIVKHAPDYGTIR